MICCDRILFFFSKTEQSIGERRLWSNRLLIVFFFYSHRIYKHDMRKERECAWGTVPRPYKLITSVRSTNASNRPFSFYFFTAPVFAPFGETDAAAAFVLFLFYQYIVDLNATIHFIFTRLRYYYYYYSEKTFSEYRLLCRQVKISVENHQQLVIFLLFHHIILNVDIHGQMLYPISQQQILIIPMRIP